MSIVSIDFKLKQNNIQFSFSIYNFSSFSSKYNTYWFNTAFGEINFYCNYNDNHLHFYNKYFQIKWNHKTYFTITIYNQPTNETTHKIDYHDNTTSKWMSRLLVVAVYRNNKKNTKLQNDYNLIYIRDINK